MSQDLADFGQRSAATQHLGRQCVTKLVSAGCWGLDASSLERMPNDRSNGAGTQKTAERSFTAQKHATNGSAAWASVAQVRRDCRANIGRKRESGSLIAFALDA